MSFHLIDLDVLTRRQMLIELARDLQADSVYISKRIMAHRSDDFCDLASEMFRRGDPAMFASALGASGMVMTHEIRTVRGKEHVVRVPRTAAQSIAESAFNHYYIRAVCQRALGMGVAWVLVYRARSSSQRRATSDALVGKWVGAAALYADLMRDARRLAIPGGVNSGISVRLPHADAAHAAVPFIVASPGAHQPQDVEEAPRAA